jgi:sugar O-acyltransferase (sialic acid O-acetyltransferase NeuD family)
MPKIKLALAGGGGHGRSAIDVIESTGLYDISYILDLPEKMGEAVLHYEVNGTEAMLEELVAAGIRFAVTVGHMRSAEPRVRTYQRIRHAGGVLPLICSSHAVFSAHALAGAGTMVFHGAVVNAGARIGENCVVNTLALVEHDATVGDHTHISTRAVVNGGCHVGSRCFVGSGAILREGIRVCDEVFIGAGSLVTHDIVQPGIYYGSPARWKS